MRPPAGISWLGIGTDDFASTLSFFQDVLCLRPMVVSERGVAILEVAPGQLLEIFGPGTKGRELTSCPVPAFEVEDVATSRRTLVERGVEGVTEIASWNGFEWFYFRAPSGHLFSIKRTPPSGWEIS